MDMKYEHALWMYLKGFWFIKSFSHTNKNKDKLLFSFLNLKKIRFYK